MSLDVSRMRFAERYWRDMEPAMEQAFDAMEALEAGEIANPDENRMVGHYWLRAPDRAPSEAIARQIRQTLGRINDFAQKVHSREIRPVQTRRFTDVVLIGIGGSALGPQLIGEALGGKREKVRLHFMDNTDPDGFTRLLERLSTRLRSTLVLVVSKSGGTPETRNGMLAAKRAFEEAGLDFASQAVAITGEGSKLAQTAESEGWLDVFPMWDWVGGRTSVMSAVGLLPAALQGVHTGQFLEGAAEMDVLTRLRSIKRNPAARMALMWHHATEGRGARDMVILPYKDRLQLLSRYLQQLVMESLGKGRTLEGKPTQQGITVYGNKGSTDQHAFVQQLREGLDNFFATFVVVRQDEPRPGQTRPLEVDPDVSSGDYLHGFWQGTRQALYEAGRPSMTLLLEKLDARTMGALIALYERAVGYYATLVNINAYHQPGVEAGKQAAASVLGLQQRAVAYLREHPGEDFSAEELAERLGAAEEVESLFHMLEHLAANQRLVGRRRRRYQYVG